MVSHNNHMHSESKKRRSGMHRSIQVLVREKALYIHILYGPLIGHRSHQKWKLLPIFFLMANRYGNDIYFPLSISQHFQTTQPSHHL